MCKARNGFVFVEEINNNQKTQGPWWKEGALVFSEISTWIVVPVVVALFAGKKLDAEYGTEPWILIALAAFGFLITAYGIVRSVRKYADKVKQRNGGNRNNS